MTRALSPGVFRELSARALSGNGKPVPHPAGDSFLTALPCGGFRVDYRPEVATGSATFRQLAPDFVLGQLDLIPLVKFEVNLSATPESSGSLIFIGCSRSAPTPWAEDATPASLQSPQTIALSLRDQPNCHVPASRVGDRIRAVTLTTLSDGDLGEFEPSLEVVEGFGRQLEHTAVNLRVGDTDKAILKAAREILSNPFSGSIEEAYLKAKTLEILCLLCNSLQQLHPEHVDSELVRCVCEFIDRAPCDPLEIQKIAAAAQVSKRSLFRKFRAETGMTVGEYHRSSRLAHAAKLLITTGLSITDIGGEVGFSETASFSRAFSVHFSMTPSEFRKAARE